MPVSKLTFQASSLSLKLLQIHIQIEKNLNQKQKVEAFQFFLGPDTKILSCFLIFVPLDVFSLECCLLHNIHLCPWTGMVIWGKKMIIIMMRLLLLLLAAAVAAKMMILAACFALLEGRRSSGGLLTKATNHGGLDKSCHPATITQSENDSTTSTRLHKSNASRVLLDDYLGSKAKHACITKECEKKIKWSNRIIPWSFSICNPTAQLQCWPSKDASEASSCFKNLIIYEECLETISL